MKRKLCGLAGVVSLFAVSMASPVLAAELLDVKPVVTGSSVVIEVTADIPMTYTYYKVPGQARVVVDIADADPEKVEPLIVVNKGAVSSISVDKAMIGDMTVSRLVFNLVSESDISVNHLPDRKTLNVSFGGGKAAAAHPLLPHQSAPACRSRAQRARGSCTCRCSSSCTQGAGCAAAPAQPASKEDDDPLGLDEPQPAAAPAKAAASCCRTFNKAGTGSTRTR